MTVALALVVQYSLLLGAGLVLYGGCLALVRRRLLLDGHGRWRWPVEFFFHGLCSVGIFVGRVLRLNSWDIVVRPGDVVRYVGIPKPSTLVLITTTFVVLVAVTVALRVPIAIHDQRRASR